MNTITSEYNRNGKIRQFYCILLIGLLSRSLSADTTFRLYPTKQATVSINSTHFNKLICFGRPWSDYSRALLKFDLSQIPAEKFGRVKRAILKLYVKHVENPSKKRTKLLMMTTSWNNNVSWSVPDEKSHWKMRKQWSEFDYSTDDDLQFPLKIAQTGEVAVDITRIVDAWLYQGRDNDGVMIKTGGYIAGRPNAGKWEIEFSSSKDKQHSPKLIIEMEENKKPKVLNRYPSAFLPPINQPYLFVWFGGMPAYFPARVFNVAAPVSNSRLDRGILQLNWFWGPQDPYRKSEKAVIDAYVSAARSDVFGFAVDEWQDPNNKKDSPCYKKNPYEITGSIKGLIEAKQIAPDKFWAVYWRGEKSIIPLVKKNLPDLLIIEGYTHARKGAPGSWTVGFKGCLSRIDKARKLGMIEKTVLMLGMIEKRETYPSNHVLTPEVIEKQVETVRRYAPEMPGIGFYHANDPVLAKAADDACRKFYIEPAPEIQIVNPRFQQKIDTMHIELRVKAKCKGKRKVKFYRWFIDNREIAKTTLPYYIIDVRSELPGIHMMTVQAIDTDWYRSACQIPIIIASASP